MEKKKGQIIISWKEFNSALLKSDKNTSKIKKRKKKKEKPDIYVNCLHGLSAT